MPGQEWWWIGVGREGVNFKANRDPAKTQKGWVYLDTSKRRKTLGNAEKKLSVAIQTMGSQRAKEPAFQKEYGMV